MCFGTQSGFAADMNRHIVMCRGTYGLATHDGAVPAFAPAFCDGHARQAASAATHNEHASPLLKAY